MRQSPNSDASQQVANSGGNGIATETRNANRSASATEPSDNHAGSNSQSRVSHSLPQSTARRSSPRLSAEGLTVLLALMCVVPAITIFGLWSYLPPVFEGQLDCGVQAQLLPPADFYLLPYKERTPVTQGEIIVENRSETDWTHINIQINTFYQIYDVETLRSGESRTYVLNRFISRTGARFDLTYNPLKAVRVYARRPQGDRATFYVDFQTLASTDAAADHSKSPPPNDNAPKDIAPKVNANENTSPKVSAPADATAPQSGAEKPSGLVLGEIPAAAPQLP